MAEFSARMESLLQKQTVTNDRITATCERIFVLLEKMLEERSLLLPKPPENQIVDTVTPSEPKPSHVASTVVDEDSSPEELQIVSDSVQSDLIFEDESKDIPLVNAEDIPLDDDVDLNLDLDIYPDFSVKLAAVEKSYGDKELQISDLNGSEQLCLLSVCENVSMSCSCAVDNAKFVKPPWKPPDSDLICAPRNEIPVSYYLKFECLNEFASSIETSGYLGFPIYVLHQGILESEAEKMLTVAEQKWKVKGYTYIVEKLGEIAEKGFYEFWNWFGLENCYPIGRIISSMPRRAAVVSMFNLCAYLVKLPIGKSWRCYVIRNLKGRIIGSWIVMIAGCIRCKKQENAARVYSRMLDDNVAPNGISMMSFVIECGFVGAVELVKQVHAYIVRNKFQLSLALATVVDMYGKCSELKAAKTPFDNDFLLLSVNFCKSFGLSFPCRSILGLGFQLHKCVYKAGMLGRSDMLMLNSLVDMYGKCFRMDLAVEVFSQMDEKNIFFRDINDSWLCFRSLSIYGVGVFLTIGFDGTSNDRTKGFYRSTYEIKGEKRNMAITQLDSANARRCFHCWDEPAGKAPFKITLDVPSQLFALSNMSSIEEKSNGELQTLSYRESLIMSTYLVTVLNGLFDFVEDQAAVGIEVRVYCQVGKASRGKITLDVVEKTLGLCKDCFSVQHSLPKLDTIVIPDLTAGAMENYGAHELAHQWFGNLVTMEWWTHLWQKDGFATWVNYIATDAIFTEWKIGTQFLDKSNVGINLEGLTESHPIEVDVKHGSEIDKIFDAVGCRNGVFDIHMLQSYLGAEFFQLSLAEYIKRYACSNAKTEYLWAALKEGSGQQENKLMISWTKQQGYPIVSVKLNGSSLEFEQSQFLSSGAPSHEQWVVPITLCQRSYDSGHSYLLKNKTGSLDIRGVLDSYAENEWFTWVKLNVDQSSFYRVQYDDALAARIHAIQSTQLSATDRYGILDYSFALSRTCISLVRGMGWLVRSINKVLLFSLSRPLEVDDLEDKVIFKGRGMMRTYYFAGRGLKCLTKAQIYYLYKNEIL